MAIIKKERIKDVAGAGKERLTEGRNKKKETGKVWQKQERKELGEKGSVKGEVWQSGMRS